MSNTIFGQSNEGRYHLVTPVSWQSLGFVIFVFTKSYNQTLGFMIRHTVVFKLKCPKGSDEENEFLMAASSLSSIPGIFNFESLRQVSKKNDFDYGLSMEFATAQSYNDYNKHPDHTNFVEIYWIKYVEKFIEIDYEQM